MKTLDELMVLHGSDKASTFSGNAHDYARRYDFWFTPIRYEAIKLLEIGVLGGNSIRAWLKYFPSAAVFGVDIEHDTNEWNVPGVKGRYVFTHGDQASGEFWKSFIEQQGGNFDLIIDDGGHFNDGIITSFNALWPSVKRGGFYVIEDLATAYGGVTAVYVRPGFPNHMDFVKGKIDEMHMGVGDLDSVFMSKELVIFKKA